MFLGRPNLLVRYMDVDPDPAPDPSSSSKNSKKNIDSYCSATSL